MASIFCYITLFRLQPFSMSKIVVTIVPITLQLSLVTGRRDENSAISILFDGSQTLSVYLMREKL